MRTVVVLLAFAAIAVAEVYFKEEFLGQFQPANNA
jgi:hypothetical protein